MFGPKITKPHSAVNNCIIPHDLYYDTKNHYWLREEDADEWTLGLTDMAQTLGGKVLHFKPWAVGKKRKAGKPIAMLEAAKWLGVVRVPFDVTITGFNEELLDDAYAVNQYPYTRGWIIRFKTEAGLKMADFFPFGEDAAKSYTENFKKWELTECVHCLGFEV